MRYKYPGEVPKGQGLKDQKRWQKTCVFLHVSKHVSVPGRWQSCSFLLRYPRYPSTFIHFSIFNTSRYVSRYVVSLFIIFVIRDVRLVMWCGVSLTRWDFEMVVMPCDTYVPLSLHLCLVFTCRIASLWHFSLIFCVSCFKASTKNLFSATFPRTSARNSSNTSPQHFSLQNRNISREVTVQRHFFKPIFRELRNRPNKVLTLPQKLPTSQLTSTAHATKVSPLMLAVLPQWKKRERETLEQASAVSPHKQEEIRISAAYATKSKSRICPKGCNGASIKALLSPLSPVHLPSDQWSQHQPVTLHSFVCSPYFLCFPGILHMANTLGCGHRLSQNACCALFHHKRNNSGRFPYKMELCGVSTTLYVGTFLRKLPVTVVRIPCLAVSSSCACVTIDSLRSRCAYGWKCWKMLGFQSEWNKRWDELGTQCERVSTP